MTEFVHYKHGMDLGYTFDLKTFSTGLKIFPNEVTSNKETVYVSNKKVKYCVVASSRDINNLLETSCGFSLKMKAKVVEAGGVFSYIVEDRSAEDTIEILAVAHIETFEEKIGSGRPIKHWHRNCMGQYFIRGIVYGGSMVVRIRFVENTSTTEHKEKFGANFSIPLWSLFNAGATSDVSTLEKKLRERGTIDIAMETTALNVRTPTSICELFMALDDFQKEVRSCNGGRGVPIKCELVPLSVLKSSFPQILKDSALEVQLNQVEDQYDDVCMAERQLNRFVKQHAQELSESQKVEVVELDQRITRVLMTFNKHIASLDLTTDGAGIVQMKPALDSYENEKKLGGFVLEVKALVKRTGIILKREKRGQPEELPPGQPLNLILIGKTGHGKSATANTIMEREMFTSQPSSSSVTDRCQLGEDVIGGRNIKIVDTPGAADTRTPLKVFKDITRAMALVPSGFHAFLVVLRYNTKITHEERLPIYTLKRMFGEQILKERVIFIFTYGDDYSSSERFEIYIEKQRQIRGYLSECEYRYLLWNNRETDHVRSRQQVVKLAQLVDKILENNNITHPYTDKYFLLARRTLAEDKRFGLEVAGKTAVDRVANVVAQAMKHDNRACFPAHGTVQTPDRGVIPVSEVKIGDKLLCCAGDRRMHFDEVYLMGHADSTPESLFVCIKTQHNEIELSPEHHIYIASTSTDSTTTVPAKTIKIGHTILALDSQKGFLEPQEVTSVSWTYAKGLYAPFTLCGNVAVDGVLASCYVDAVPPSVAHLLLWPIRRLYRTSPWLLFHVSKIGSEGMPWWIKTFCDHFPSLQHLL